MRETRRPPDYDRDRRKELRWHVQKADAIARELLEPKLREEIVPRLEQVERAVAKRETRA